MGAGIPEMTPLMFGGKGRVILTFWAADALAAELTIVVVTTTTPGPIEGSVLWLIVPKRSALPNVIVTDAGHVVTQQSQSTSIYAVAVLVILKLVRSDCITV